MLNQKLKKVILRKLLTGAKEIDTDYSTTQLNLKVDFSLR